MSTSPHAARVLWLHNPVLDTLAYSFGWVFLLVPLLVFRDDIYSALYYSGSFKAMMAKPDIVYPAVLILMVFIVSYVHRHLTFAMVYAEREELMRRRRTYIILPIALTVITVVFLYFGIFVALLTMSVLWNVYHVAAQKYGITRIYSRKAGYGLGWIDKGILYSWIGYLVFAVLEREQATLLKFKAGRVLTGYLGEYSELLGAGAGVLLAVAIVFTAIYVIYELKNLDKISIPKNIYVISILALYSVFLYDVVLGYLVFGFSHALEYIAFVNMFVKRKYKQRADSTSALARASRQQWLYSGLFSMLVVGLCLIGMNLDRGLFETYIIGSSFLHFIYDGWIWKVRRPEVGKPLDIKYATV